MKLPQPFYRLPLLFDPQRLAEEVSQINEAEWRPHPQGHVGNSAFPLVALGGDPANEATDGPMRPTPFLARFPYLRQVMAAFQAPVGRTRLMRIAGHGEATAHVDTNYYWSQRVRIHVPVVTYPGVRFSCGDQVVTMTAGESWIFDTWRPHNVTNPDDRPRVHLVVDTVGSAAFWDLVATSAPATRVVPFMPGVTPELNLENRNFPVVMSPWELEHLLNIVLDELADVPADTRAAFHSLHVVAERLLGEWRGLWATYGDSPSGWPRFEAELRRLEADLKPMEGRLSLPNGIEAAMAVMQWVVRAALNPKLAPGESPAPVVPAPQPRAAMPAAGPRFVRPVFIVASPRSGSSLLFETLAKAPGLFTLGGESHGVLEGIPELTPAAHGWASNRLTAAEATPAVVERLQAALLARLKDREGGAPAAGTALRMLEKTPKNALRIPFLAAAFPDALFIYLARDPRENLASIIEAWGSGRFVTYPELPGWSGPPWSLLLIPGWPALAGKTAAEIAAAQWEASNRLILDDLAALPPARWSAVSYADLLAEPQREVERLARFVGLEWDQRLTGPLPLSAHTLTPPAPDKWRKHEAVIEPLLSGLADTRRRAVEACAPRAEVPAGSANAPPPALAADGTAPMRSVHTTSFPPLLRDLGASVLVTTYQAGKLVLLRTEGALLNTHFRNFPKPMGLALRRGRLALGTEIEVREFRNVPAVAKRLKPPDKNDAVFLPRSAHATGDVQIHDLAFAGDELWFVNTSFSCLCTLDPEHSFVPRWRPPFITALAPEDRCHLNGLAVVDDRPRYATALGETDEARGWRERKRDGGIVMDLVQNEVILRGLSMPHSPRWHEGKLWLLNSGEGSLGFVDLKERRYREVARVPGFTRGLDFAGRFAFIGLSQVRESAVFSGIAIAELPVAERRCGVWVVDTLTGATVAFTRFEDAVQEIFAVEVARGLRFPEILNDDKALISNSFVLPEAALAAVPTRLK